jgi:hypothetical protein
MRTELGTKPSAPFSVTAIGKMAHVRFWENAVEVKREEGSAWAVDEYSLAVRNRPNLETDISKNLAAWLEKAKAAEQVTPPKPIEERVGDVETDIDLITEVLLL